MTTLTDLQIKNAKYQRNKANKLYDANGLYLVVTGLSKKWYVRYTFNGKRKDLAL